jgi:hypothetical protein
MLSLGKHQLVLLYGGWPEGPVVSLGGTFQDEFIEE